MGSEESRLSALSYFPHSPVLGLRGLLTPLQAPNCQAGLLGPCIQSPLQTFTLDEIPGLAPSALCLAPTGDVVSFETVQLSFELIFA